MAEGRDWTLVQFEACPDCGTDATATPDTEVGPEIVRAVAAWGRTLAMADPRGVRVRPSDTTWSALEYAAHVRDVLAVMQARIDRMIAEDNPELGWWDHEAAVVDDRYNEQVPVLVQEAMSANARAFAAALDEISEAGWDRPAVRRQGEEFTVRGIARFVLHEVIHHREDAERVLHSISASGGRPS